MSILGWMTTVGALLLLMALTSSQVERLPISTSFIYLVVGLTLGPLGFGLLQLDIASQRVWMETLTEVAVIVSLFVGGLRLRLPLRNASWRVAVRLAGPVMLLCIAGVALTAQWLLGVPLYMALLLGAILAPTDPVLAAAVSVNDAEDHDRVRFGLSGEAGLNDGAAFPFVIFALEFMRAGSMQGWIGEWLLLRIVWAIPAGLAIGYLLGTGVGQFAMRIRSRARDTGAPNDFLALALIALAYVAAERAQAWGFLSVFAAGVGLRHAEVRVVRATPHPAAAESPPPASAGAVAHPPAETLVAATVNEQALEQPAVAAGVLIAEALSFGDTLERMLEVLLVVLVGIALATAWSWPAAGVAALLFVVIRPLAARLSLIGTRTRVAQRWILGWFGIRGIGSLYYLSYALNHGVGGDEGVRLVQVVITVVACSIVVHGISVTPVLQWYERSLKGREVSPGQS
ncbi:MAG: cation:proton antiporter [Gemmatimonadota bacterium]